MHRVKAGSGDATEKGQFAESVGFDVVGAVQVPRVERVLALLESGCTKAPYQLDVFRVWVKHRSVGGTCLHQVEEESVVVAGEAEVGTFFTTEVHEELV
ncbi:unannotated protein [freshwater metagenome]|uniref:Unannotated protein n=1 Tax=freshwater metagenome TaxID=449393 RepID=A0A6J6E3Y4_9ZZZZ